MSTTSVGAVSKGLHQVGLTYYVNRKFESSAWIKMCQLAAIRDLRYTLTFHSKRVISFVTELNLNLLRDDKFRKPLKFRSS